MVYPGRCIGMVLVTDRGPGILWLRLGIAEIAFPIMYR